MASAPASIITAVNYLHKNRGLAFPVMAMSLVLVILIPLPTGVLDPYTPPTQ